MNKAIQKLMMALAVCGAVLSVYGAVQSGIVGYNTISLEAGKWYLVAPQFKDVASDTATVDLLSNVKFEGLTAVPFTSRASGAQIQVFNPASQSYTIYYYISDSKEGTAWARTKNNVPTEIPLSLGEGFWLKVGGVDENGAALTVQGSVYSETSKTAEVGASGEWQILCNPYPVALDWSALTTAGIEAAPFANRATLCPQIQVYNASSQAYTIFYYISDSKEGIAWARTKNNLASGTMAEVGQAFWVKSPTTGTLTFRFSN